jgi:hypothetical protein
MNETTTMAADAPQRATDVPAGMAGHPGGSSAPVEEFGGLTSRDCSWDCTIDHCVITHRNFCGHPAKGGLQPTVMVDPEAMRRYNRARRVVAMEIAARKADRGEM